jgi:hypothetical protein
MPDETGQQDETAVPDAPYETAVPDNGGTQEAGYSPETATYDLDNLPGAPMDTSTGEPAPQLDPPSRGDGNSN